MADKMKGLLLEVQGGRPDWNPDNVCIPSAGSGEVARYAAQEGHDVYVADMNCTSGSSLQRVEKALDSFYDRTSQRDPDFFMLTGMTCKAHNNARLATHLKERYESIPIIMGGVHVSGARAGLEMAARYGVADEGVHYAFDELAKSGIDYLYSGEAINIGSLLSIISAGSSESDLSKIRGVSYLVNGGWVHNQRHLDATLELPNGKALKEGPLLDNYLFGFNQTHLWRHGPAFPFRISKGCNQACKFCSAMAVNPRNGFKTHIPYTPLDLEHSFSEFEGLLERGAKFVFFTDENPLQEDRHGVSHGRVFLEEIIKRGWTRDVKLGMMTSGSATANEEEVALMKRANVMMAMVGYESFTNPEGLGKTGFDASDGYKSVNNLKAAGIINMDGAIVGGFEDDAGSIARELDLRMEAGLDKTLVQPLQPYFATKTRIEAIQGGLMRNDGREDNGFGGFGGMHGQKIASLATKRGLEPLDVTEAIVSADRRNSGTNVRRILTGAYIKNVPSHIAVKLMRSISKIPGAIARRKFSDRQLAEILIEETIKRNTFEFS